MFSPLEQFEIIPLYTFFFFFIKFIFSNLDSTYIIVLLFFSFLLVWFNKEPLLVSKFYTSGFSFFFQLIRNMLLSSINVKAIGHMSLLSTFFLFILTFNLTGLIPFGFCATSQIIITQFLGCLAVMGLTLKGIQELGLNFINVFIPRNVPLFLLPFLSIIEIISFISRMFSLSIRLFANMVAGHALLHILMGAVVSVFKLSISTLKILILFIIPSFIIFIIFCLELGIGFLQSYVFVVLFTIYLADAYKGH